VGMTIRDIARLAGVSHATVSRVINNNPNVNEETREKIKKLIKENKFSPNSSARSLISGKTNNIGLLILYDLFQKQFPLDFLPAVLAGMVTRLNEYDYNLSLLFNQLQEKKDLIDLYKLSRNNYDGIFVLSLEKDSELAYKLGKISLPLVLVNQKIEGLDINYVVTDDETGAYEACMHLINLGHKKIGFIEGDPRYGTSVERKRGYYLALNNSGIDADLSLQKVGYYDQTGGYVAMQELLKENKGITAVFASNDFMALGAMKAIKEKGLRIPEDIAVVGFDDTEFAALVEPAMTTVRKPRTLMGYQAANLMINLLKDTENEKAMSIVLPANLIVRKSSEFSRT